jgi:CheY-like chemotaxis protein
MFKILMIDDEVSYHSLYEDIILEEMNANIDFATDGLEALEVLAGEKSYDLLILDLDMPRLDGISTLKKIRQNPKFRNIPISILTANNTDENQLKLLNMGANDFISKGCTPEIFLARLKNLAIHKVAIDSYKTESINYEGLLKNVLDTIENTLSSVTESVLNGAETISTDNYRQWLNKKSKSLKLYDQTMCSVIDKVTNPDKNLNIITINLETIKSELNNRKQYQFSHLQDLDIVSMTPRTVKTDMDLFYFLISSICSDKNCLIAHPFTWDSETIMIKADNAPSVEQQAFLSSLANLANFRLAFDSTSLQLTPMENR